MPKDVSRPDPARPSAGAVRSAREREVPDGMPWLVEARRLLVTRGPVGLGSARRTLRLLAALDSRLPLGLPWCGLFAGHCFRTACPGITLPRFHARARPWLRWGAPAEPQVGALLVLWHYWRGGPFGHVGFYWAEDEDAFHVLGGNQRDRITIQRYPKDRLLAIRWPEGVPRPGRRRYGSPDAAEPFYRRLRP